METIDEDILGLLERMRVYAMLARENLIRDLIRETDPIPHDSRSADDILFAVRRLLAVSSQQAYLDEAAREGQASSVRLTDAAYDAAVKYLRRCWHEHTALSGLADPGDDAFEHMVAAVIAAHAMQSNGTDKANGDRNDG